MPHTLRRYENGLGVQSLGNVWTMLKADKRLVCALSTHPLGWELRVSADAEFVRSEVCRDESDVFRMAEAWKNEATPNGWKDSNR